MSQLVGVAFWLFIASIIVAGIWLAHARNKETQKTIRLAIEKGVPLDPAMIDKLVVRQSGNPEDYYIGGYICIACAIGLPIFGYFIGRIAPQAFYPIVGAGVLVGLVGISLIICGKVLNRRLKSL